VALTLILLALAISLEPFPLLGFILLLVSEGGRKKAIAFLAGWMATLIVVIGSVALISGGNPVERNSAPSTAALVVKLVLGIFLVGWGIRAFTLRKRPAKQPSWMKTIDKIHGLTAVGLAVLVQPWALVAAGAAVVLSGNLKTPGQCVVLVLFVLMASAPFLAMIAYTVLFPDRATKSLANLRHWIDSHRVFIQFVVCILIGLWLVVNSSLSLA
jgi:hypothetical protein